MFRQQPHPKSVNDIYHIFDMPNALNVLYWNEIFLKVHKLKFDTIIEFGIGRGRSLISILTCNLFRTLKFNKPPYNIYALDSFKGFPIPSVEDKSLRLPKQGEWSKSPNGKYKYSPKNLKKILKYASFRDISSLKVFPGFFSKTIPKIICKKPSIGILHLDGDLFKSVFEPLINLHSLVVKGGIIVFDDYELDGDPKKEPFPGCRKALEKFLATEYGSSFILKKTIRGNPYLLKIHD